MVVVVAGEARHPFAELQATTRQMDAGSPPLPGAERVEDADHLTAATLKGPQRLEPIAARVLTLLGPSVRIERMADLTADAPGDQRLRRRAERENQRLVHRKDGLEADQEELLHVPQVTDDLL